MRRILLGLFILLHGFAHANIGVWAFNAGPTWLVTALWSVAMLGYIAVTPSLAGVMFGPLNVFVFEPALFIMQRGMLRGIRDRAERAGTVRG